MAFHLLLESGDDLLLESGDFLELESLVAPPADATASAPTPSLNISDQDVAPPADATASALAPLPRISVTAVAHADASGLATPQISMGSPVASANASAPAPDFTIEPYIEVPPASAVADAEEPTFTISTQITVTVCDASADVPLPVPTIAVGPPPVQATASGPVADLHGTTRRTNLPTGLVLRGGTTLLLAPNTTTLTLDEGMTTLELEREGALILDG